MSVKPVWQTTDGKIFTDQNEALVHDAVNSGSPASALQVFWQAHKHADVQEIVDTCMVHGIELGAILGSIELVAKEDTDG